MLRPRLTLLTVAVACLAAFGPGASATTLVIPPAGTASGPAARTDAQGFIVDDPATALRLARETGQPLFIDFSAIWCPPCNQLVEKVFSQREFQERTARFVRLKLDADNPVSFELKSRFAIGPYPTLVFASSEGEEIARVVGFLSMRELIAEADRAWHDRASAFPALVAKADAGDAAARERLGLILLERHEWAQAMRYLQDVPSRAEEQARAQIGLLQVQIEQAAPESRSALEDQLIAAYQRSIEVAAAPSADAAERSLALAKLLQARGQLERREQLLAAAEQAADALTRDPAKLAGTAWAVGDCWSLLGEIREALGKTDPARETFRRAAAEYAKQSTGRRDRGASLEQADCLARAGDRAAAEAIYRRLEASYPREFTFWFNHAQMLFDAKQAASAEPLAKKALGFSYGDNRLRAAGLLAKIEIAQGRRDEARALVARTLADVQVASDARVRTHRYVRELNALLAE